MKHAPERSLVIVQDTREPSLASGDHPDALVRPWRVRDNAREVFPLVRATIREGDYSLPGLCLSRPPESEEPWSGRPLVAIERKALGDAISSIVGSRRDALGERAESRERFEAELCRLREYAWKAIVIEGCPEDVQLEAARPERRFNAASVLGSYAVFSTRFGVQVWWAGNRAGAEWYIGTMLARIWSEATGGEEARKARARGDRMPWLGVLGTKEESDGKVQPDGWWDDAMRIGGSPGFQAVRAAREDQPGGFGSSEEGDPQGHGRAPDPQGHGRAPGVDDRPVAPPEEASRPRLAPLGGMTASSAEARERRAIKRRSVG